MWESVIGKREERRDERRKAEEAGQEREDDELKLAAKTKMTGEAAVKQKSGKGRTRGRTRGARGGGGYFAPPREFMMMTARTTAVMAA